MPSLPAPRSAPENGPRHAAQPAARARTSTALTATTGGFPHVQILEGETTNGRHRRPESLADPTVLRPPTTTRVPGGRRTSLDLAPRRSRIDGKRRGKAAARRSAGGSGSARGKHARSTEQLAITVRPLPAVRDAAEAVRGWALADSGRPPATGSHRAPGTLPIESWLLIGRRRQQALLAALVAVGLLLLVPIQQRSDTEVNPVNAAGLGTATATKAPAKKPGKPAGQDAGPDATAAPKPDPSTPAGAEAKPSGPAPPAASASQPAPMILVPAGTGPASSLRTTGSAAVALTFDDGPDPVQTPRILALLAQYQVKATFCVVGSQVQRHPEIVRQIVAAGHTLCNHTWDHSFTIGKKKPERIQADLRRTNEAIRAAVPGAEIPFFRAPGGNFTDALVQTAYVDGMTSLYWEVDTRDWEHDEKFDAAAHVERIIKSVQKETRPGAIVLSHDFNQPTTIQAYEVLLPWLAARFELGIPDQPPAPNAAPNVAGNSGPDPAGDAAGRPSESPSADPDSAL
jgi:peptidoglycan/xylan/chitin deacetylase (PgdA/CDA1 family)